MALMETPVEQFRTDWPDDGIIGRISAHMATVSSLRPSVLSLSSSVGKAKSKGVVETKGLSLHFRASDADNSVHHLLSLINTVCSSYPSMADALMGCVGGQGGTQGGMQGVGQCESVGGGQGWDMGGTQGMGMVGGAGTGLLRAVFSMPLRYFEEERFRVQLLPSLISLFRGREKELQERILEIVKNSMK